MNYQETFEKNIFKNNEICCICLDNILLWKTSCNHIICKNCIIQIKKPECPMCRKNIKSDILKNKDFDICIFSFDSHIKTSRNHSINVQGLPLIALQYHEVHINVNMDNLNN